MYTIICQKRGRETLKPIRPALMCFIRLQTPIINSFVDVFGKKQNLTTNNLIFLKKIRGGGENALKKALTLQLDGGFPSIISIRAFMYHF